MILLTQSSRKCEMDAARRRPTEGTFNRGSMRLVRGSVTPRRPAFKRLKMYIFISKIVVC
jgi:hypothetical protein